METNQTLETVVTILENNKGEEILKLDVHELTTITSWMVICTATSKRHAHALSDHLVTKMKEQGNQPLGVEGDEQNEWILIDLDDIIVHIMLAETRKFYSLEKLWTVTLKVRENAN